MASVRQTRTGSFELTVRHKDLPTGRKFFQFPTREAADEWGDQWDSMVKAGIPIPPELLEPSKTVSTLVHTIRAWRDSGNASKADQETLTLLLGEVGEVDRGRVTYAWAEGWVRSMKIKQNLAPSTIRKRVGALSRAIDAQIRTMPEMPGLMNPLKLLPDGYSHYNEKDVALVTAAGKQPKADQERDRRLHDGEQDDIESALKGIKRPDRQRALSLPEGDAMRVFFLLVLMTGARLQEAFTLRWDKVDFDAKVIRIQTSKQRRGKVVFRAVPIRKELYGILMDWFKARASTSALVFPFWNGTAVDTKRTSARLSHRFTDVFAYAGCANITEHDLRHEATCRWLELRDERGQWFFRLEEINRLMGWSANSKMAQKYASFRGEDFAERLWVLPT